ncbi:MAG: glutathione S-transferase family protein [Proteobacteria bacterium]|nr:glutathione S-transferase family protein [Pseudomonadota bacterium]
MRQFTSPAKKSGDSLTLISHHLCPYVQRAAIALAEKGIPFERVDIDLANKPDWFKSISPLGKTPILLVGEKAIFESAVILEYLEDTLPNPLHPRDPLARAEHRGLIEYASAILSDISAFYSAPDAESFEARRERLRGRFAWLEGRVSAAPWFDGEQFSIVDAAHGPVFRYFDVFDRIADFGILADRPKLARWRKALSARPSIRDAVTPDYNERLWTFLKRRKSFLSESMTAGELEAVGGPAGQDHQFPSSLPGTEPIRRSISENGAADSKAVNVP